MEAVYDGDALRAAAETVLATLPPGPVVLYSSSDTGAGLAAACAALRGGRTSWRRIDLLAAPAGPQAEESAVIVVEAVDAGAGWRDAVSRRYPDARVVIARPSVAKPLAA